MADLVTDWTYYTAGANSIWTGPNAINHICLPSGGTCTGWGTHVPVNPSHVLTAIGNCNLHDLILDHSDSGELGSCQLERGPGKGG